MTIKKDMRHLIDVSYWDKTGSSFWGLTRKQAKILAYMFILPAIILALPPMGIPGPDDFANLFISGYLVKTFGINPLLALVYTYTLFPLLLFFIGIWIFPYNTQSLLNGYISKLKVWLKRSIKKPIYILIGLGALIVLIRYYLNYFS